MPFRVLCEPVRTVPGGLSHVVSHVISGCFVNRLEPSQVAYSTEKQ